MAEYIEREAAVNLLRDEAGRGATPYHIGIYAAARALEAIPAADVRPVVQGRWLWFGDCSNEGLYCSVCRNKIHENKMPKKKLLNFCPNCGSDMREES